MDIELTLDLGWAKGVDLETWVSTWGRRDVDWILKIVRIPWGGMVLNGCWVDLESVFKRGWILWDVM